MIWHLRLLPADNVSLRGILGDAHTVKRRGRYPSHGTASYFYHSSESAAERKMNVHVRKKTQRGMSPTTARRTRAILRFWETRECVGEACSEGNAAAHITQRGLAAIFVCAVPTGLQHVLQRNSNSSGTTAVCR